MLENSAGNPVAQRTHLKKYSNVVSRYGIVFAFLALIVIAQIMYPRFLDLQNISNILSQNAPTGIIAVGMTLVMLAGGFDLSVGAIFAAGATVYASLAVAGWSLPLAGIVTVLIGIAAGLLNGIIVTRLKVNTFVATLGTSTIISGAALLYSKSAPFVVKDSSFTHLGRGEFMGISISIWILVAVFAIGAIVTAKTVYGQMIYAIGGNNEASRLAGLPVEWIRTSVYVIAGACSALAGMIISSRIGVGQADIGASMALDVIAVVVVGGTSLLGGEGGIWRTAIGLLILAVLSNLLDSLAISSNYQSVIKGIILICAVALDALTNSKK